MRDDIQPKGLMISTTLRAVMIYQVCDLDKKILQKIYPFLQYFLERKTGIEPAGIGLGSRRSTIERLSQNLLRFLLYYIIIYLSILKQGEHNGLFGNFV